MKNKLIVMIGFYFIMTSLNFIPIYGVGSILKPLAIVLFALFLFYGKFRMQRSTLFTLFLLFLFYALIISTFSIDTQSSLTRGLSLVQFFILIFIVDAISVSEKKYNYLYRTIVWSSRVFLIVIYIFGLGNFVSYGRIFLDTGVFQEDPNFLIGYLIFGVSFSLLKITESSKSNRLGYIIEIILYLIAILLSGSRGGLFAIVTVAMYILAVRLFKRNNRRKVLILVGLIFTSFVVIKIYVPESLTRFNIQAILDSDGTGRFTIWKEAISVFSNSDLFRQLFGYGIGTAPDLLNIGTYVNVVSHNIFLDLLLELGIFGLILFMLINAYLIIYSVNKKQHFIVAATIGFLALSISLSTLYFKPFWSLYMFSIITFNHLSYVKKGDLSNG